MINSAMAAAFIGAWLRNCHVNFSKCPTNKKEEKFKSILKIIKGRYTLIFIYVYFRAHADILSNL